MNAQEKAVARIFFQNKIYRSDGQSFQDLFNDIMSYAYSDFRRIKAWGNIGDEKNDGYFENNGIYYQVYAPEDLSKSYVETVNKIERDFSGLLEYWDNVNQFYFVVNDKYKGVHAESEKTLTNLKTKHSLEKSGFLTSDNLENELFKLQDDHIYKIIGFLPDIEKIVNLDYTVLNEVIGFIMKQPLKPITGEIKFPDWDEKIKFNKLSPFSTGLLNHGSQTLGSLEKFLATRTSLAEELQQHMTRTYESIKEEWKDLSVEGDNIFYEIIDRCSPRKENSFQLAVVTIMSKYFESCDIFEEPIKE
ncbi:MAG: hypothetical protein JXA16_07885 [Bacteroidales bacterium]|nr:hypothetical protein [Bacteroidales bacterium]